MAAAGAGGGIRIAFIYDEDYQFQMNVNDVPHNFVIVRRLVELQHTSGYVTHAAYNPDRHLTIGQDVSLAGEYGFIIKGPAYIVKDTSVVPAQNQTLTQLDIKNNILQPAVGGRRNRRKTKARRRRLSRRRRSH